MRINKATKNAIEAAIQAKKENCGMEEIMEAYNAKKNRVVDSVKEIYNNAKTQIDELLKQNDFTPSDAMGSNILGLYLYKLDTSKSFEVVKMATNVADKYFKDAYNSIVDELKLYGEAADLNEMLDDFKNHEVDFMTEAKNIVEAKSEKLKAKREAEAERAAEQAARNAEAITALLQEEFNIEPDVEEVGEEAV